MSDQYVADDERDAILDRLLTIPDNKVRSMTSHLHMLSSLHMEGEVALTLTLASWLSSRSSNRV